MDGSPLPSRVWSFVELVWNSVGCAWRSGDDETREGAERSVLERASSDAQEFCIQSTSRV